MVRICREMIFDEIYDKEQMSMTICGNVLAANHFPLLWHGDVELCPS